MKQMSDKQIALFIRQFCRIGHNDGEPIEQITFSMNSGRIYDLYSYGEIKELVDEVMLKISLGCLSVTDMFVIQWLKANGVIQAFISLEEYMMHDEDSDKRSDT